MKRKLFWIAAMLIAILLVLGACGQQAATVSNEPAVSSEVQTSSQVSSEASTPAAPSRTDIKIAMSQEPATLDPNNMGDGAGFQVSGNIYDGLVWVTDDFQIEPRLAKTWDISSDGKEYTFHLRDDVNFHNGEHFTSADVKFTYDRAMASKYAGSVTSFIDSVEVVDDYTIKVTMKAPFAPSPYLFGSPFLRIVNQKAVEAAGEAFAYNPGGAGTGPYKFVSWTSGDEIVLEANDNYFIGAPSIKKVIWKMITDQTATTVAIQSGDMDLGMITPMDAENFKSDPNVAVSSSASVVYNLLGFNYTKAPFDNVLVRQAIAYSCDKNELISAAFDSSEGGSVTAVPVLPTGFGYNADLKPYTKDIEKAKQLLAQAGYPNGFTTTIYTPTNAFRKNIATYMQSCLAEIGITADIQVMDMAALLDVVKKGGADIFVMGYNTVSADADFYYYNNYYTGMGYNYTKYTNPTLDTLLAQARAEQDTAKRADLYKQISQIVYDDVPDLPLFFYNFIYGCSSKLNYNTSPLVRIDVYHMSWKS